MVSGKKWNGVIIFNSYGEAYMRIDGQSVPIAKSLLPAFQVIGQTRQGLTEYMCQGGMR